MLLCDLLCSPLLHLLLWLRLRYIRAPFAPSRFSFVVRQAIERATGKQFEGRQQQEGGEEEEDEEEEGASSGEGADDGEQQQQQQEQAKGAEGGAAGGDEDGEVEPAAEDQAAMTGGALGAGNEVWNSSRGIVPSAACGNTSCVWAPCRFAGGPRGGLMSCPW